MTETRDRHELLLLSGLSVGITFLILELFVRLFFLHEVDPSILRRRVAATSVRNLLRPSADPVLFTELKPGLEQLFHGCMVVTGPDGYRIASAAPETAASLPAARLRIAVLGDSSSFGWGVNYDETYAELYRVQMEKLSGIPIELRNYSVPSYNAQQELRMFQTRVKSFHPDLIVVHHDHNDSEPTTKALGTNYMPPEYGDNVLRSALIKWGMRRMRRFQMTRDYNSGKDGNRTVDGQFVAGPLYEAHLEARRKLVSEAAALHIPVVIVLFNAFARRDPQYETSEYYVALHRDLAARLEGMGYHVLDLYPRYQEVMRERGWPHLVNWWVTPEDAHPSPAAHQFIADRLVDYTRADRELSAVFNAAAVSP
jgi:hypothetical protein